MTATVPIAWFVWRPGMRGPTCEIWHQETITRDFAPVEVLAKHPLTAEEAALSFQELAAKYPPPPMKDDA